MKLQWLGQLYFYCRQAMGGKTGSGQFGPGQFGPGQFGPGQFGTRTIRSRTIRYQDNSVLGQFGPGQFGPEMTITQKIIIGNILNLIFLSNQPIPDLSCKSDTFEKKNWCCIPMHAKHWMKHGFFWYDVDTNLFRLWSTNPKKIADPGSFFSNFFFSKMFEYFWTIIFSQFFFFKSVQIKRPCSKERQVNPTPFSFDPIFMNDAQLTE